MKGSDPVGDIAQPEECLCSCHHPTKSLTLLHFRACCEGRCYGCEKHFVTGLERHIQQCPSNKQDALPDTFGHSVTEFEKSISKMGDQ